MEVQQHRSDHQNPRGHAQLATQHDLKHVAAATACVSVELVVRVIPAENRHRVKDEDPHEYYKRVIAPFKGELEMWYQENRSFILDMQLIFMTAWVILFPNSNLYEKWFKDLPMRNF